jgi:hypothetical protein
MASGLLKKLKINKGRNIGKRNNNVERYFNKCKRLKIL